MDHTRFDALILPDHDEASRSVWSRERNLAREWMHAVIDKADAKGVTGK
jgi:hypothetical protein